MIISFNSQKGGVSKSTSTQTIGSILTSKGYKTLIIDVDSQCNMTYSTGIDYNPNVLTIYEVLQGKAGITKAIQKRPNYDVIPSHIMLDNLVNELDHNNPKDLVLFRNVLKPIKNDYDFILIDTGPSLDIININILIGSDYLLVPTTADLYSIQGIGKLLNTVKNIKKANSKLQVLGIFLVKYKHWTKGHQEIREMLNKYTLNEHIKLFNTFISDSVIVSNSQGNRQDLIEYDKKSKVFIEYEELTSEILEELKKHE